ncbi:MAG: SRPBCC domain-containing protein [Bacteroidota bacterium]
MTKLLIISSLIIILLVVLAWTGHKSVHHEIEIEAPPEVVWSVLMDADRYDEWNPVMKLLEGDLKEGNQVKYQFTQDENTISEISSTVKQIVSYQLLNQQGGVPLIITFDHQYILTSSGEGTLLTIHEEYRGIYVNFWNPDPVQAAYQRLNQAIKTRTESLYMQEDESNY